MLHNGKAVFQTNGVRKFPQRPVRAEETQKLFCEVNAGGIIVNMVVDVGLVGVGRNDELVTALCPAHSQLVADMVSVLWRDLPGQEGLAFLIANHVFVRFLLLARGGFVFAFP